MKVPEDVPSGKKSAFFMPEGVGDCTFGKGWWFFRLLRRDPVALGHAPAGEDTEAGIDVREGYCHRGKAHGCEFIAGQGFP